MFITLNKYEQRIFNQIIAEFPRDNLKDIYNWADQAVTGSMPFTIASYANWCLRETLDKLKIVFAL